MIQTNELRVGNVVQKNDRIYVADFLTIRLANNYEPIPITKEWLIHLGFKYNNSTELWEKDRMELCFQTEEISVDDLLFTPEIKYVHQLQNLFFALTNTEL